MKRRALLWAQDWDYVTDETGMAVAIHGTTNRELLLGCTVEDIKADLSEAFKLQPHARTLLPCRLRETEPCP